MPVTLTISVSRREADRPRLLQLTAFDAAGVPLESTSIIVTVDDNGTLDRETALDRRELVTGAQGVAIFQWWEWPRQGPARDFTSVVTAACEDGAVSLWLEDLYE